jgi:large subunit ribosomal protein L3
VVFTLLGNKIGMTQIFDSQGNIIPVTVIKVGPCCITQIKSQENCGYKAIQIGYVEMSNHQKRLTKPELGHFIKKNLKPYRHLKECKVENEENYTLGENFNVEIFSIGQYVKVTGASIGKGNTGNVKANNFSTGAKTHGSKHHRLQGSLGAGTSPGRVFPGKKMPGRTGNQKCTIKNLEIVGIKPEENLLIIKGSIPGKPGNLVSITNL